MKTNISHNAPSKRNRRTLTALGMIAALALTVGCSETNKPSAKSPAPEVKLRTASLNSTAPLVPDTSAPEKSVAKQPAPKQLLTYKSRNYGVSFSYPWQYSYWSAKAVANDNALQPAADGHDGQFTLARIDVPKGFYPDTDFDTGYFALSLNQEIGEQECAATLNLAKDAKPATEIVNGTEFRWAETNSGGRGSASKVRNMVSFVNGTCYEVELAVKTRNSDGLAREIDPDQVMRRLESIVKSVKIESLELPAGPKDAAPAVAQN